MSYPKTCPKDGFACHNTQCRTGCKLEVFRAEKWVPIAEVLPQGHQRKDDAPLPGSRPELPMIEETPMPRLTNAEAAGCKPSNPKDQIGSGKMPLHLWPKTASVVGSLALTDGALKYGRSNWRVAGVKATIYTDALERHMTAWLEGEDVDPDSGIPHLGHALACLAILVDAQAAGKLTDDRQVQGGYRALLSEMTPHVARLKTLHSDKEPKHYTISDNQKGE